MLYITSFYKKMSHSEEVFERVFAQCNSIFITKIDQTEFISESNLLGLLIIDDVTLRRWSQTVGLQLTL